jgi:UDP-hydrolysing UDP-N-acetyl-D-glucosamine 2-epimerase
VSPRRVAVATTSRADYGLLSWLLKGLESDRRFSLQLVACGSHLSPRFGRTIREIESDGFRVAARVDTLPRTDSDAGVAEAIGRGAVGFAEAFRRLAPDLLLVLGDRYELLSAASAALAMRIPIAHVHGGESTEGVLDEQVRHAVSKMSHLHFPAAETYRRRLIAMGEDPRFVFSFGAPGLEAIRRLEPEPREALERRLGVTVDRGTLLVTYHPDRTGAAGLRALFAALDRLGLRAVFTAANADAGGSALNRLAAAYCAKREGRCVFVSSLGHRLYLSLARLCGAVVGNSSSGIIEVPSLGVPTVNVGDRQKGRLRSPSVIDCAPARSAIEAALRRALTPAFRRRCRGKNAYGDGRFSERAIGVLARAPLGDALLGSKTVRRLDRRPR